MEVKVGQFEDQFLKRFGLGLRCGGGIYGKALAQSDEDWVHGRIDPASLAAHTNAGRLLFEAPFQHAQLRAVQRKWDDWVFFLAPLLLHLERVA